MKHVSKEVLLWYAAHEMYALVVDVQSYPSFLPWCEKVDVLARHDDGLTARLHVSFSGLRTTLTTRNVHVRDASVHIGLVDGPFSLLEGFWQFKPLPAPAAATPVEAAGEGKGEGAAACKVEFELRYTFANAVLEMAVSPVFDRIADTFVDSFVRRAEHVYGHR